MEKNTIARLMSIVAGAQEIYVAKGVMTHWLHEQPLEDVLDALENLEQLAYCYIASFLTIASDGEALFKMEDGYIVNIDNISYGKCTCCGEYYPESDLEELGDSTDTVCSDCLENSGDYCCCEDCGGWYSFDSIKPVYGDNHQDIMKMVCENCARDYVECEDCGDLFMQDCIETDGVHHVCLDCFERYWGRCESCGDLVPQSALIYLEEDDDCEGYGGWFCQDCFEEREQRSSSKLREYHQGKGSGDYNMAHHAIGAEIKIGPELEMEADDYVEDDDIEAFDSLLNASDTHVIFSKDGSLDEGVEFVGCPASYSYHKNNIGWREALKEAIELGYRSHNGGHCGLHMHVDRAYFKEGKNSLEEKFATVFGNNVSWLRPFSRRHDWGYCAIYPEMERITTFKKLQADGKSDNYKTGGHNVAMNYANPHTIEFRLFRGTLKYSTFLATLQLVTMWCYLVRKRSLAACANITLKSFVKLAKARKYTEFITYLDERNIDIEEVCTLQKAQKQLEDAKNIALAQSIQHNMSKKAIEVEDSDEAEA